MKIDNSLNNLIDKLVNPCFRLTMCPYHVVPVGLLQLRCQKTGFAAKR